MGAGGQPGKGDLPGLPGSVDEHYLSVIQRFRDQGFCSTGDKARWFAHQAVLVSVWELGCQCVVRASRRVMSMIIAR